MLVGLAVILLFSVSHTQNKLNEDRQRLGFTKLATLENAPPVLAFTSVALGGFRGLIANILWIRATDLQDKEKYFEFVQLSDWITKLEPHFAQVWSHQAWNMAWNISVKFKDPRERWLWVQRGLKLLRDEGLKYNPDDAIMYNSLAWIFQMKMGQDMDDAQLEYKLYWATEMDTLFGGNADIPKLLNPQTPEEKARVKKLKTVYHMDPVVMKEVNDLYGPLEWRLPEAHVIYWAELGRRKSKPKDQDTLRRNIYQALRQAFFRGGLTKIISHGTNDMPTYMFGPNLDVVDKAVNTYEWAMEQDPKLKEHVGKAQKNFIREAIYLLYSDGRTKQAQYWFDFERKHYPTAIPKNMSLEEYAIQHISEIMKDLDRPKITAIIEDYLHKGYFYLTIDKEDAAEAHLKIAEYLWTYFQTHLPKVSEDRLRLDPLPELKKVVLSQMLDPQTGLQPEFAAILRTRLNLPQSVSQPTNNPVAPVSTNAPAVSTNATAAAK